MGQEITDLLAELRRGDRSAMDRLMPLVYDELRQKAHQQLAGRGPHVTLSTTGLVHETYLKLVRSASLAWEDRNHFFAVAVKAMRSVIVDYARQYLAQKRGGAVHVIELDEGVLRVGEQAAEILAIHSALDRLADLDGRLCQLVELRFFGGLSIEETARVMGLSERTVKREWSKARTLLFQWIREG